MTRYRDRLLTTVTICHVRATAMFQIAIRLRILGIKIGFSLLSSAACPKLRSRMDHGLIFAASRLSRATADRLRQRDLLPFIMAASAPSYTRYASKGRISSIECGTKDHLKIMMIAENTPSGVATQSPTTRGENNNDAFIFDTRFVTIPSPDNEKVY